MNWSVVRPLVERLKRGHAILIGLSVAVAVGVVSIFYATRGFNEGFTDMGHDGYVLKVASDLCVGKTLFKETFTQYGIAGDHFNCAILRLHDSLLTLKYVYALVYALSLGLLAYFTARWAGLKWAVAIGGFALLSAPFYRHGIMLSVQVLILPLQVCGVAVAYSFVRRRNPHLAFLAGLLGGIAFLFKQSTGLYQIVLTLICLGMIQWMQRPRTPVKEAIKNLSLCVLGFVTPALLGLFVVATQGSLHDWWAQTVVFPRSFYTNYMLDNYPFWSQLKVDSDVLGSIIPWPIWATADAIKLQFWWMCLRGALIVSAIFALKPRATRGPAIVVLCSAVAGLLVNFPSFNFMHQWWSVIPWLGLVPVILTPIRNMVLRIPIEPNLKVGADSGKPHSRQWTIPVGSLARDNRRAAALAVTYFVALVASIGTIITSGEFRVIDGGNIKAIIRTEACYNLSIGTRLDGVCTTRETERALAKVLRAIDRAETKLRQEGYAGAEVRSVERTDGIGGIVKTLLILSESQHAAYTPALWQLPILRDLYPNSRPDALRDGTVLVDYGKYGARQDLLGFDLLEIVPDETTSGMAWKVFIPTTQMERP